MSEYNTNINPLHHLSFNNFLEFAFNGDGNSFSDASKYIDKTENNYKYYRNIIYEYSKKITI